MADRYNETLLATMDRDARAMYAAGTRLGVELNAIWAAISAGSVGITSAAADVDAVALANVVARRDKDTAPGTTLLFAWKAFRVHTAKQHLAVAAGSFLLTASATNYVEVDLVTGTVSRNTAGFTAGRFPLWTIAAGATSYTDASVVGYATPYTGLPPAAIDGTMLSTPGKTKEIDDQLGTIATAAGATAFNLIVPSSIAAGSKLTSVRFVTKDGLAASDTNYITFGLINKGANGALGQILADAANNANSTKLTGGTALSAYVPRGLVLVTLTVGTERDVTGGDVLELTLTVTGTLANTLRQCAVLLEFTYVN